MTTRPQIATRIHALLLEELGEGIRIERMLRDRRYARDVLLVCDAIKHPELNTLAREFREAVDRPRAAPQQADWASDTSGFGVSQPAGLADERDERAGWLESTWRRISGF